MIMEEDEFNIADDDQLDKLLLDDDENRFE